MAGIADFGTLPYEVIDSDDDAPPNQSDSEPTLAESRRPDPELQLPILWWLPWLLLLILGALLLSLPVSVARSVPVPSLTLPALPSLTWPTAVQLRAIFLSPLGIGLLLGTLVAALLAGRWLVSRLRRIRDAVGRLSEKWVSGVERRVSASVADLAFIEYDGADADEEPASSSSASDSATDPPERGEVAGTPDGGAVQTQPEDERLTPQSASSEPSGASRPARRLHNPKVDLEQFDEFAVEDGLDHLVGSFVGPPVRERAGEVVVSDLVPDRLDPLAALPERMAKRRREEALKPLLIGVPQAPPEEFDSLVDAYDATLFIADEFRWYLLDLLETLPEAANFPHNQALAGVGAPTFRRIDLADHTPRSDTVHAELTQHRGKPLHSYAESLRDTESRNPALTVVAAPEKYLDHAKSIIEDREVSPTLFSETSRENTLSIVRFYLEEELSPRRFTKPNVNPAIDWDALPQPPTTTPDSPPPNSHAVAVDRSVLDEMAAHAAVDPEREQYGVVYERNNWVMKYFPIQSEEHVIRKPRKVSFQSQFKQHVRQLASLYDELGFRLAGDCHSHPQSGNPKPSDADLRSFKKFWNNDRNTYFIVGLDRGDAPEEWTHVEDGEEVRRQLDGHLVRIRAYSTNGNTKRIILHESGPDDARGSRDDDE